LTKRRRQLMVDGKDYSSRQVQRIPFPS
jgi:hypothetical protein